ncbi:MAG: integrase arm-type DNA-binding domain-containing protein [Deltaproteobacteria bacterium]|nr:integrase arm-type DNA-binding domain-containing protein [Deltaproteobacteria bacterium]
MQLKDLEIKNLKPPEKPKKLSDGGGLYLYLAPNGLKSFRFDYRFQGKRRTLTIGTYPEISLKEAREKLIDSKRNLREGIDPGLQKKIQHFPENPEKQDTFESVAREWFERKKVGKKENYTSRIMGRLEKDLFPFLAVRPVDEINAPELLAVLRKMESRGVSDTAHRCLQYSSQIFRYAISTGRVSHDVTADLKGALTPAVHSHFSSLTDPKKVGELLRAIDSYTGNPIVRLALKMAPYVFVRPGELRHAEWAEIDLESATWKIPANKMKMKQVHLVPLATQVIGILKELHCYTGTCSYLFPSMRTNVRPISDVTLLAGLRRLGFSKDEMTVHGFRSIASTLLNEQGYNRDWIERQLAHSDRSIRASYNYADYLPNRRIMMQEWADYLDKLVIKK